jgi:hypothetical protein
VVVIPSKRSLQRGIWGKPREASRGFYLETLRRNNRAFGSHPYQPLERYLRHAA